MKREEREGGRREGAREGEKERGERETVSEKQNKEKNYPTVQMMPTIIWIIIVVDSPHPLIELYFTLPPLVQAESKLSE